jgi:hypothetical protein
MRSFAALSNLLLLVGCGQTDRALAAAKPKPPTTKEALRILIGNASISIVGNTSCETVKQPGDETLADYLSTVMAAQTDPTIRWRTEVTTKLVKGLWQVDVNFLGEDASDVYDMGIRFVTNPDRQTITPGSVRCIGTS